MRNFKIFVEGKADVKFIADYILAHFQETLSNTDDFYILNSWSGYKSGGNVIEAIKQNFDNGSETILILDADNNFNQQQAQVLNDFKSYNIPVHLFLSPNNASAGNLETILCEIAVEKQILTCFDAYESCISPAYKTPITKAKIFAYLDALLPDKHTRGGGSDLLQPQNRNYRNTAHWDLHHQYLQPLRVFLSPFFN